MKINQININKINYNNNIQIASKPQSFSGLKLKKPLEFDTLELYEKFNTQEIKGKLSKAARKNGVFGLSKERKIEKLVKKVTSKGKNKVGSGCEAEVFRIPRSPYDVKLYKNHDLRGKIDGDINGNVTFQDKLNHIVAKAKSYLILEHIEGVSYEKCKKNDTLDDYYKLLEEMPQEAYDDLIKKIGIIHQSGQYIDTMGDNLIIDTKNKKFEPIDLVESNDFAGYFDFGDCWQNEYCSTFDPFKCVNVLLRIGGNNAKEVFRKTLKAVAKDCNSFTFFKINYIDFLNLNEKYMPEENSEGNISYLLGRLYHLQEQKEQLLINTHKKKEIENILKEQIDSFVEAVDKVMKSDSENKLS